MMTAMQGAFMDGVLYDDGGIACGEAALVIKRYYPWGAKTIPYAAIQSVDRLAPLGVKKWRLWGSGDFIHWWNLDTKRPKKQLALVLDIGQHIRPTITPDDPTAVERILTNHLAA
jgi:hypothetical protein